MLPPAARSPLPALLAALVATTCSGAPNGSGSSTGSSTAGSSTAGSTAGSTASTGAAGGPCADGDFLIMDQCYREFTFPDVDFVDAAVAADFDGDGNTELVTTCPGGNATVALCLLTTEALLSRVDLDWAGNVIELHLGDFDGDGTPDVLVSGLYRFRVYLVKNGTFLLQHGFDYYQELHDPADSPIFPALPIDIDGDGKAEIVTSSWVAGLRPWRYDPMTMEWAPWGSRKPLFGCGDMASGRVADLDGDSRPELLAIGSHNNCEANMAPGPEWNRVSVFSTQTGELTPVADFPALLPAEHLELGDFNADGKLDLVTASRDSLMIFPGDGTPQFLDPTSVPNIAQFTRDSGPRATDFNADGQDELWFRRLEGSTRYHLLTDPLAGTESIDLPDAVRLQQLTADLNHDGHTDIVALRSLDNTSSLYLNLFLSIPPP